VNAETFDLDLPAAPEHLGTARAFVASLARGLGVSGELVEDLKLAVSEACTDALPGSRNVRLRAVVEGRVLRFEIDAPGSSTVAAGLDAVSAPARFDLVRSLFPDAVIEHDGPRRQIRFTLPIP